MAAVDEFARNLAEGGDWAPGILPARFRAARRWRGGAVIAPCSPAPALLETCGRERPRTREVRAFGAAAALARFANRPCIGPRFSLGGFGRRGVARRGVGGESRSSRPALRRLRRLRRAGGDARAPGKSAPSARRRHRLDSRIVRALGCVFRSAASGAVEACGAAPTGKRERRAPRGGVRGGEDVRAGTPAVPGPAFGGVARVGVSRCRGVRYTGRIPRNRPGFPTGTGRRNRYRYRDNHA